MPYVNIKATKEGVTADQKAELIREVTDLLADVLGKNPATTVVVLARIFHDFPWRDREDGRATWHRRVLDLRRT